MCRIMEFITSSGNYYAMIMTALALCISLQDGDTSEAVVNTPVFLLHPSSLLVPVNTIATFECSALCVHACQMFWYIGSTSTAHNFQSSQFENQGYVFIDQPTIQYDNRTYRASAKLTVNASLIVHGSLIRCQAVLSGEHTQSQLSKGAVLKVISVPPVTPNPSVIIKNLTSILLEWSPPFLWPGQVIEYYMVSVTNEDYGQLITQERVNSSFDDVIVSLEVLIDERQRQECNLYKFRLSAVDRLNKLLLTLNVTRGFPSNYETTAPYNNIIKNAALNDFANSSINISVYYLANLTPLVMMDVKLPTPICSFQELNYTININDMNGSSAIELGPYYHIGSGIARHITSGLKRSQEYSVTVTVATFSSVVTSDTHVFDTNFHDELLFNKCQETSTLTAVLYYQVTIGVSLTTSFIIFLILITVFLVYLTSLRV